MKILQKSSIVKLVIVAIVVLVIGFGTYLFQQGNDWKTYRSTDLGFEFRYPSGWQLKHGNVGEIIVSNSDQAGFFTIGRSYVIIYPNGKPGSGVPPLKFEEDNTIVLSEEINSVEVVRLENGDIAAMNIDFKNPSWKNADTEIYAGIEATGLKYTCISEITGKEIPDEKCFSGFHEPGEDYGTNRIAGSLNEQEKLVVYEILRSFKFIK